MESHTWLHQRIVGFSNHKRVLFVIEANSKTEIRVAMQLSILRVNKVAGCNVSRTNRLTDLQLRQKDFKRLMAESVCLLLGVVGIYEKGARDHGGHVTVFAAAVDVNSLRLEFRSIAVDLELVQVELTARLNQHRQGVIKVGGVGFGVFRSELFHSSIVVEAGFDFLLNGGVLYLEVTLNHVFDLAD